LLVVVLQAAQCSRDAVGPRAVYTSPINSIKSINFNYPLALAMLFSVSHAPGAAIDYQQED
jgi:hypothetical protein